MEKFEFEGNTFNAHKITLCGIGLIVLEGKKGFLGCGYINIEAANKFNQAAAIVTGVKNFDDMTKAKIVAVSESARAMGLELGMLGAEALKKFA